MKKAYVIGHPIAHSKSPLIHNHWLKQHDINGLYTQKDVTPDDLGAVITQFKQYKDFVGCNVTVPHKEAIMQHLDHIDETAQKIGAVNTVYRSDDGLSLIGTNTDAIGFVQNIKHNLNVDISSDDIAKSSQFETAKTGIVHIFGAGGAARSVLYGLLQEGFTNFRISNRTRVRAEELAAAFTNEKNKIDIIDWSDNNIENDVSLCVNTTSLGMKGCAPFNPDLNSLNSLAITVDIVYNPLYTGYLVDARSKGLKTITGIGMLLYQAQPAFKTFFGVTPNVDKELEELVLAA